MGKGNFRWAESRQTLSKEEANRWREKGGGPTCEEIDAIRAPWGEGVLFDAWKRGKKFGRQ